MCETDKLNTNFFSLVDKKNPYKISDKTDINAIIEKGLTCLFSSNVGENGITQDLKAAIDSVVGLHFFDPYNKTTTKFLYDINKEKLKEINETTLKNTLIELLCNKYILTNAMRVKCNGEKDISEIFNPIKGETVETEILIAPFKDELSKYKITIDEEILSSLKTLQHYKHVIHLLPPNFKFNIQGEAMTPGMMLVFSNDGLLKGTIKVFQEVISQIILVNIPQSLLLYHQNSTKTILEKSYKSAIAAIMSRNGSHNIGSHVLAAVGTSSIDLPDDQILFKYIQHRMDYIAQITTEIPCWTYSSLFVQDIMRRFFMQRHLLNNIARSEGLEAYEYQKRNPNGKVAKNKWGDEIESKLIIKVKKQGSDKYFISPYGKIEKKLDALSLAIPGGVIGQHAFFTIMENIIRNSAKHEWSGDSSKRTQKNLEITIGYEDNLKNDFVVFRISDNVSDVFTTWKPENKGDKAKEAQKPLPDDSTKQCMDSTKLDVLPLHQRLNCYLSKSFVDQETGKLLQENWGLAEMKISAGYLNKKNIEEIGEDGSSALFNQDGSKDTGLIRAIGIEDKSNDKVVYRLGFEFAVPKPKELLIIGKDIPEELIVTEAKESSIYFSKTDPKSLDYEFVLFQNDQCEKLKKDFEYWHYPHRLFCICKNNKQCNLKNRIVPIKEKELQEKEFWEDGKWKDTIDWDKLKLFLYTKWIEYRYLKNGEEISLYVNTDSGSDKGRDSGKSALGIFLDYYKDEIYNNYLSGSSEFKTKEEFEKHIRTALYGSYPITTFDDFRCEFNKKIAEKLKDEYEKYLKVISDVMIKYDEDIETLPECYIAEDGNGSGKGLWKDSTLFNNNEKIKLVTNENHAKVKYKRHANARDAKNETYYEALSGSQTYFSMLENPPTGYHKKKLALQLVENALAKILIIDERAANYYLNGDSKVKRRLDKAGICIVSKFNYNGKLHKVIERKIKKSDPFDGNHKYNYLIIHQGILDKLKPNKQCTEEEKNNYLVGFIDYLKKHCGLLAVTSGRGQPDQLKKDLEKNLKFLPFSNLESFVLKPYHEKFLLVQVLDQLIRERKTK